MRITVIQSQTQIPAKNAEGKVTHNLAQQACDATIDSTFSMMDQAADAGTDLIVTIEALNQLSYSYDSLEQKLCDSEPLDGALITRFSEFAKTRSTYIVAGLLTSRHGKCYNSAILFDSKGNILGVFDKIHLPAGEARFITPGSEYPVFETPFGTIGLLVCWDLQFPEAAREVALRGADIIACPTWGWEKIYGLSRAYENSVTIAAAMGVNSAGKTFAGCDPSAVVNNMGNVIAECKPHCEQWVTAEIDIKKEPDPQYGSGSQTGLSSMRQIRFMQRKPETYTLISQARVPLGDRYKKD